MGKVDPMWAILTHPSKFGQRWTEEEFFDSGRIEIDGVISKIDDLSPGSARGRALDFGCGIGRLSRALCAHYQHIDAVDVAPSMIALANERNLFPGQCAFHLNSASDLALFADQTFDLIYSNIVLQHMPPELALGYLSEFARCTKPGGLIVFQVPHRRQATLASMRYFIMHAAYKVLPAAAVKWYRQRKHSRDGDLTRSVVAKLPKNTMEMHSIRRSRVVSALQNCSLLQVEDSRLLGDAFVSGTHFSSTYFFRKKPIDGSDEVG